MVQDTKKEDDIELNKFEWFANGLIVLWLFVFTLTTFKNLGEDFSRIVFYLNNAIMILFVVEYLVRIILAPDKRAYLFSFMGIVDFCVCLPALALIFHWDWAFIDVLRLARILALFELGRRFQKPFADLQIVFHLVKHEFIIFITVMGSLLYITAMGVYYTEHSVQPEKFASFGDGLWFAIVTLSTTGYGYIYPITPAGRIFTGCIIFIGMLSIAISMGMVTSAFSSVRSSGSSKISASQFKKMLESEIARKKDEVDVLKDDEENDVALSLNDVREIFKKYEKKAKGD